LYTALMSCRAARISIASPPLAVLVVAFISCAPFGGGTTSSSSSSSSGGDGGNTLPDGAAPTPNEAGIAEGGGGNSGPSCTFLEILSEPFMDPELTGWQRQVSNRGTFEVIQNEVDGPTPKHDSYGSLSGILGGEANVAAVATIQRTYARKARAAKVVFDLAHRTIANKTDFGCTLLFARNTAPQKSASVTLRFEGSQNLVFDGLVTAEGSPEQGLAGQVTLAQQFPINKWSTVTIDMEAVGGGNVDAGVTINNVRTPIPRFPFGAEVEGISLSCGITYMEPQPPFASNRTSEVALDELRLSICPL
jgi:hypothetical protein